MRKIQLLVILCSVLFISTPNVFAGGGAVGASPGTGLKLRFGSGTDIFIPIRFEGEGYIGSEDKHGLGGNLGFDIGTGNSFNIFGISPEYKYYCKGGRSSSPFVGAYADFRFRSNFNIIGVGAQGGYQHYFNDNVSIYGAGSFGFATAGFKSSGFFGSSSARRNGGEFGFRVGVKYAFGG